MLSKIDKLLVGIRPCKDASSYKKFFASQDTIKLVSSLLDSMLRLNSNTVLPINDVFVNLKNHADDYLGVLVKNNPDDTLLIA